MHSCSLLFPPEKRSAQQAKFEYLRGKVLDVTDVYKKEAEDHLSKAVINSQFFLCFITFFDFCECGFPFFLSTTDS